MKMVIQLLTTLTHQGETFLTQLSDHADQRDKVMQYLTIRCSLSVLWLNS